MRINKLLAILSWLLLFTFTLGFGQSEIVPNNSFEKVARCPKRLGQIDRTHNWFSPNPGTPDYFHACFQKDMFTCGVPNNFLGTTPAYTGNAYAGLFRGDTELEFITVELQESLLPDSEYVILLYAAAPNPGMDAIDELGAILTEDVPPFDTPFEMAMDVGKVKMNDFVSEKYSFWHKLVRTVKVTGNERFLTIGYFTKTDKGRAYSFIDDVSIMPAAAYEAMLKPEENVPPPPPDNHLANSGFEKYFDCPDQRDQLNKVDKWSDAQESPDFFHRCGELITGAPRNELGFQEPKEGDAYSGFWVYLPAKNEYREILVSPIEGNLEKGKEYCISAWISLAEISKYSIDELEVVIPSRYIGIPTAQKSILPPRFPLKTGEPLADKKGWTFVYTWLTAAGSEEYLMIGNFKTNKNTRFTEADKVDVETIHPQLHGGSYYYLDDIRLTYKGSPDCPCEDPIPVISEPIIELEPIETGWEKGKAFVLENVTFAFDKSTILPESYPMLDSLSGWLEAQPNLNALVSGHTDNVGKADYNLQLSARRADAIKTYLIDKGIGEERLRSEGFGDSQPVADNKSAGGRALNRRVEVAFD